DGGVPDAAQQDGHLDAQGAVSARLAAIIAGGRAARLAGQPKGLLAVGGRRIIDRQLEALGAVFERLLLVTNDAAPWADLPIPVVGDRVRTGAGPLAGIDAALASLPPHENEVVCVGGDMPFITPAALGLLRDEAPEARILAPRIAGRPEPLFARYNRACAAALGSALASGRFTAAAFLDEAGATYLDERVLRALDPTLTFLFNVNTPEDLAE